MNMWVWVYAIAGLVIGSVGGTLFGRFLKRRNKNANGENKFEGDIFINREGEMYAQFDIPIEQIQKTKAVHMKVHYVKGKGE